MPSKDPTHVVLGTIVPCFQTGLCSRWRMCAFAALTITYPPVSQPFSRTWQFTSSTKAKYKRLVFRFASTHTRKTAYLQNVFLLSHFWCMTSSKELWASPCKLCGGGGAVRSSENTTPRLSASEINFCSNEEAAAFCPCMLLRGDEPSCDRWPLKHENLTQNPFIREIIV